jgi:hypothetical protein
MAFLADGELAEQALNRASPLDREHKRLGLRRHADVDRWWAASFRLVAIFDPLSWAIKRVQVPRREPNQHDNAMSCFMFLRALS